MKLHEVKPAEGSRTVRTRVGRGISSGQGKTSGRGQKGQGSRSSVGLPKGFEGGQMRLAQRLPKLRGFHNRFRKEFAVINVGKLNRFEANSVVDAQTLRDVGLIGPSRHGVKVLSAGELRVALTLRVHRISAKARVAVEAAGGSVELIGPQRADRVPRKARGTAKKGKGTPPPVQGSAGDDEKPVAKGKAAAAAADAPVAEAAADTGAAEAGDAGDGDSADSGQDTEG
jgi:large subunit ribosomal protein L15